MLGASKGTVTSLLDAKAMAREIIERSGEAELPVRAIGGVAIKMRCPSADNGELTRGGYPDIDLCGRSAELAKYERLFGSLGFASERSFNIMNSTAYLRFNRPDDGIHLDVFVDRLQMCHTLVFGGRLLAQAYTLPLEDLLLSKLQIVQLNAKDLLDILALLMDHDVAESADPEVCDVRRVAQVCANDWGWYRTVVGTLGKVKAEAPRYIGGDRLELVLERVQRLEDRIEAQPKSLRWKLRARVGERVRWYELPEDPTRASEGH